VPHDLEHLWGGDLVHRPVAEEGQHVAFQLPRHRDTMLLGLRGEMPADPFAGDGVEAWRGAAPRLAGIDAFGERAPGIGAAGTGLGERDLRPSAESEALFLAVEALLHAPELGVGGMQLDAEAEAVEAAEGLGGADGGVAERADSSGHDQGGDAPKPVVMPPRTPPRSCDAKRQWRMTAGGEGV
jgi:hypothetical protein